MSGESLTFFYLYLVPGSVRSTSLCSAILVGVFIAGISFSYAQSGFYLTYKCLEGDARMKAYQPSMKKVCIVDNPVVGVDEIVKLSNLNLFGNHAFFDLHLSPKGAQYLTLVATTSEIVAFIVNDRVVFTIGLVNTQAFQTIRVVNERDLKDFIAIYQWISNEVNTR
jgi:hypothetical protein